MAMTHDGDVTNREILDALVGLTGAVGERFEAVDRRFEAMHRRFEAMHRRFEEFDCKMTRRFDAVDLRFDALERRLGTLGTGPNA